MCTADLTFFFHADAKHQEGEEFHLELKAGAADEASVLCIGKAGQ